MNKYIIFSISKTEKEIKMLRSHFENMETEIESFDKKNRSYKSMKRKVKIIKFNLSLLVKRT